LNYNKGEQEQKKKKTTHNWHV